MPVITSPLVKDERMGWSTYQFSVDGLDFIGLTDVTGKAAAERLHKICEANSQELLDTVLAANTARARNQELMKTEGKGKDWPAFRALDKLRDRLLKEANIWDS
jgi:hypothetical protein